MELTKIIETLTVSNSPSILILIVGMLSIVFIKEYLRAVIRLREIRLKREELEIRSDKPGESSQINVENLNAGSIVDGNFKLLEKYYEQHLVEYKLMARASLVIAILGFLVIVIGVFFTFSQHVSVGVITSIAGLVSEAAAVLFFKQNNLLIDQIKDYHKKLVSTQYLLTTISLAAELPQNDKNEQRKRIIGNLLFLSNELHGSTSDHLFIENINNEKEI